VVKKRESAKPKTAKRPNYDDLRLEETIGFLLADSARTMTRVFSARIAAHGIGMGVFTFLRILWEEDGLTQTELADKARMRGPSAAAALHELERRGFVRRKDDPEDRRKVRVVLTSDGRRLYGLVMPHIAVTNQLMLRGFTTDEQLALKQMLRRIRINLAPSSLLSDAKHKKVAEAASRARTYSRTTTRG
jgi:DNA-binding MarR family transcriptional regulator